MKKFSLRWWISWTVYGLLFHPFRTAHLALRWATVIPRVLPRALLNGTFLAIHYARIVKLLREAAVARENERLDRLRNPHAWRGR
jgi:hypothetical protein